MQNCCQSVAQNVAQCFFEGRKSAVIPTILNFESLMAVREGFEPSIRYKPYNELATRRIRPLCHLTYFNYLIKIVILYFASFFFKISLTNLGLAFPFVSCIICPIKYPYNFSFPDLYSLTLSIF